MNCMVSNFFIKTEFEGRQIELELFGDEVYTTCPVCGRDFQVGPDVLGFVLTEGDLWSTKVSCGCELPQKPNLFRVK